jgi:hypothetical protein
MNNPPAFPTARVNINGVDEQDGIQIYGAGMTLRDYFAAKAMQGTIEYSPWSETIDMEKIAQLAYRQADAMLKARET